MALSVTVMKMRHAFVLTGMLISALLLTGCMAAMMPAMMLGHAAHNKRHATRESDVKSCDCEKTGVGESASPSAPAALPVETPPGHQHGS